MLKWLDQNRLELYLFSSEIHGDFHEDYMNIIMNDLIELMDPHYIEVWGQVHTTWWEFLLTHIRPNYGRPNSKYEQMAEHRLMNHDLYPEKIDNR